MDESWKSFINASLNIQERTYSLYGSKITYPVYASDDLDLKDWFSKEELHLIEETGLEHDPDFKMLIVSIKMALKDTKLSALQSKKVSLVIAHENLGVGSLLDKLSDEGLLDKHGGEGLFMELKQDFYNIQSFPHLFYVSRLFGIKGQTYFVNNACASGSYALELGRNLIGNDSSDIVIVATSDYAHPTEYLWLEEKGFCSKEGILRPFDRSRDGTVLGDGAGTIILESEKSAKERGVIPYCEYAGASMYQDTWRMTLPDVSEKMYRRAIESVLELHTIEHVDLLIPHATGSKLWDSYEFGQLQDAFQHMELPMITAFKPYIGHTLGASSLVEIIILIECMKRSTILPLLHFENPDKSTVRESHLVTSIKHEAVHTALKTVSAYGGFNTASLFKRI